MPLSDNVPLSFRLPLSRSHADTCSRYDTRAYHPLIFSPDSENLEKQHDNNFPTFPDFSLFRILSHKVFQVHTPHRDFPCCKTGTADYMRFPHSALLLSPADRACQGNRAHTYVLLLPPWKTTPLPVPYSRLYQVRTGTFFRCGIPDRCYFFSALHNALPLMLFGTTHLPFLCLLHIQCPVHKSFPCRAWHTHFPALPLPA